MNRPKPVGLVTYADGQREREHRPGAELACLRRERRPLAARLEFGELLADGATDTHDEIRPLAARRCYARPVPCTHETATAHTPATGTWRPCPAACVAIRPYSVSTPFSPTS